MKQTWNLHIENFGKIKNADIELSPLMFFVGDNNSGKSYIMELLWGLLTYGKDLFPKTVPDSVNFKKCENWFKENQSNNLELSDEDCSVFVEWFNSLLAAKSKELVEKIFNHTIPIGKIQIVNYKMNDSISVKWSPEISKYAFKKSEISFPLLESYTRSDCLKMSIYLCWNILMDGIGSSFSTTTVKGKRNGEPIYFPASRTGFMLTYLQLLDSSLSNAFGMANMISEENQSYLSMPYVDFLSLILKFEKSNTINKSYQSLIDFMETSMINGKIIVKKDFVPSFKYNPINSKAELPLYVTSSVVSEVSPLMLLLQSNIKFNTIIIEEPEAHLHPQLQSKIAMFIVRLMNMGVNVWVTTHSDIILQHINTMINLNKRNSKDKKAFMNKYGYVKEDLIVSNEIQMYQFDSNENNKTNISKLECSEFGFVVPTFNNALDRICEEVYAVQPMEGD